MARAPDKRIEQAKGMYLKGMKLVEIASQLNLPEGTVRSWKKMGLQRCKRKTQRCKKEKGRSARQSKCNRSAGE